MISSLLLNLKRFKNYYLSFTLLITIIITFISLSLSVINGYSNYFKNESSSYYHLNYIQLISDKKIKDDINKVVDSSEYYYYNQKVKKNVKLEKFNANISIIPVYEKDFNNEGFKINIASYFDDIPSHLREYYQDNNPLLYGRFPNNEKEITVSENLFNTITSYFDTSSYSFDDLNSYNFDIITNNKSIIGYKIVGVYSSNYQKLGSDSDIILNYNDTYFDNNCDIYNYLFIKDFLNDIKIENELSSYDYLLGYGIKRYKKLLSIQDFINSVLLIIFVPLVLGILFLFIHSFIDIYKLNNRIISIELTSGIEIKKVTLNFAFQIGFLILVSFILATGISSVLLFVISKVLASFDIGLTFNYLLHVVISLSISILIFIILILFIIFLIKYIKEKHISQLLKID